jgi:hypothetical protein
MGLRRTMAADGGYLSWRAAVDHQLNEIYCITIEDAGFDEEYLALLWQIFAIDLRNWIPESDFQ